MAAASPTIRTRRPDRFRDPIATAYDAVVVGAGMGGLVATALLARAGRRVLVVDGHYVDGDVASFIGMAPADAPRYVVAVFAHTPNGSGGTVAAPAFAQMMEQLPYERLQIAVGAVASAEQAVALTTRYVKERKAFGKPLFDQQNTRFKLAECRAQAHVGRVFLDGCIARFIARSLDEASTAIAKYWLTETQCRIIDECVQLHGGYGYMSEFPIARMWADSRVQRIYAGSNEIMKELIAWSL